MKTDLEFVKIYLVYFGKRGGGQQLFFETLAGLTVTKANLIPVISSESIIEDIISDNVQYMEFPIPHSIRELLKPKQFFENIKCFQKLLWNLHKYPGFVVQIMPSPFDLIVDKFAIATNSKVIRCVHDMSNHPGDKWPTRKAIAKRIKNADYVVTFSSFVAQAVVRDFSRNSLLARLPNKLFLEGKGFQPFRVRAFGDPIRIGFAGRALRYKGLEVLGEALKLVEANFVFTAAGNGSYPDSIRDHFGVSNVWLDDVALDRYLDEQDIVIFPYIEASQSGLIPICRSKGKRIVASDIGGLSEQLIGYPKAFMCDPGDLHDLAAKIELAIESCKNHDLNEKFENDDVVLGKALYQVIEDLINDKLEK